MGFIDIEEYFKSFPCISQESEKLFVRDFIEPIIGVENLDKLIPQYQFIDSEGVVRRIDFVLKGLKHKVAFEIDGETYHAEGAISSQDFDDSLERQNDILEAGFILRRFSYTQLQDAQKRKRVSYTIKRLVNKYLSELLLTDVLTPTELQNNALEQIRIRRENGWKKGLVILPTGTGKTFLSAFDSKNFEGKILFVVHRLDILAQNKSAYEILYPNEQLGLLTGSEKINLDARILFASKDSLCVPTCLHSYRKDEFDYIIIDEVHHSEADTYKIILNYFTPKFMLGLTATPDRTDRKDILELFDYQKIYEYTLDDAITNGFLVPYNYYGLKDNIDYSNIKYNNKKYDINDLDKHLIIPKRNEQILKEYLEKGNGNKAIGFCCSIKHADAMAKYFSDNGIPSKSITSKSEVDKEILIEQFRNNEFTVAFTVDLFNEGIDFPNVRVLLFLRPTESKTVFVQQLGRGLRLCGSKDNVVVLDFIGNYKKANFIRSILSNGNRTEVRNAQTNSFEKFEYIFNPKCNVHFDAEVEQILDNQDALAKDITKDDLIAAYYELAEQLGRKPSVDDINEHGKYSRAKYISVFGGWIAFLREIHELTEASYHFPQGVHLGHIFYILNVLHKGNRVGTNIADEYVKIRGGYSKEYGEFQRQTKYKLQAMMELGLINDDRKLGNDGESSIILTEKGIQVAELLKSMFDKLDLTFKDKGKRTWEMKVSPSDFNTALRNYISINKEAKNVVYNLFLQMKAVGLMLNYLYRFERQIEVAKKSIYSNFYSFDYVKKYCESIGIDTATEVGAEHRCPFLLNILEALGILEQSRSNITMKKFIVCHSTMNLKDYDEKRSVVSERIAKFVSQKLSDEDLVELKEVYGKDFYTDSYYLKSIEIYAE